MFCLLLLITMCVHPISSLGSDSSALCAEDLENFDTCDYVYSLNDVSVNDLVIVQLNICGICSKVSLLTHMINSCVNGRHPDIVLLSEMWLNSNSPSICIPGFDLIHRDRMHKRGGGVGILISKELKYRELTSISSSIFENECITIELNLKSHEKCVISSMY